MRLTIDKQNEVRPRAADRAAPRFGEELADDLLNADQKDESRHRGSASA
jgi:hypothetical protein